MFNNEERIVLNGICNNEKLDFSKKSVLDSLLFSEQVVADEMMIDLIKGISEKISALSDEEWTEVRKQIPFSVALVPEDEVAEVPTDEEVLFRKIL